MEHYYGVRVAGPLAEYVDGFVAEATGKGFSSKSIRYSLLAMARISAVAESRGAGAGDLPSGLIGGLVASGACGYRGVTGRRSALIGYLRSVGVVAEPEPEDGPLERLLSRFGDYLARERGLAPATVGQRLGTVRRFLAGRVDEMGRLAPIGAADVVGFVEDAVHAGLARGTCALVATDLRSWLRFLCLAGLADRDLAAFVPAVANPSRRLSLGLTSGQTARLLGTCDRGRPEGRRDYAVLVTICRLGLRAGEVAGLCLDDIDWRNGWLTVRGKGKSLERLPLPVDVGEAIAAHLRGRPPGAEGCRSVFLRAVAPRVGLGRAGVSGIVLKAGRAAGLGDVRAHRLRHSVATQMLGQGVGLAQIGEVLRHKHTSTTAVYAGVDLVSLAGLARPWPLGGVR